MSDYIPPELIPNILARLPVDDVLRCTSVCKSWYSLITCSSFASSHLNLSSPNQEPRLLVRYRKSLDSRSGYYLYGDNETFDEVADLDPPFHGQWCIIDSLNGLVCLYDDHEDTIVLWNPSLRKSFTLPKPKVLSNSRVHTSNYGFGFIASSNEYKVLRLSCEYEEYDEYDEYDEHDEPQVEIFQLSTGSWRDLEVEDYSYFNDDISPKAHLNGVVHWYKSHFEEVTPTYSNLIYSFDMKTEKFGALMVPSCLRHDELLFFSVHTFRESLCLVDYAYGRRSMNIWIMKEYGIADSWGKLFSIDTEQHTVTRPLYFRHNGDLLFVKVYTSTTEIVGVSYNCNSNQVKNVGLLRNRPPTEYPLMMYNVPFMISYVESLVLLKVPNEVEIDQESTEISKNV